MVIYLSNQTLLKPHQVHIISGSVAVAESCTSLLIIKYFTDLLLNEYVHFLEEVLAVFEERNRPVSGKAKKYIGKVSFDSIVLDRQSEIVYLGPPGANHRIRS